MPTGWLRFALTDFARFQGFSLHRQVDLDVAVGRANAGVTQPTPDHVDFDTGLQQMHRRRVPQRVRRDFLTLQAGRYRGCLVRVAADDLGNPRPAEWPAGW